MTTNARRWAIVFALLMLLILLLLQGHASQTKGNPSPLPMRSTALSAKSSTPYFTTALPTPKIMMPVPTPSPKPDVTPILSTATPVPPGKPITITIWLDYPDVLMTAFDKALTRYKDEHPEVSVVVQTNVDVIGRLTGAENSAKRPDLFSITSDRIGAIAEAGLIIPLDEFAPKYGPQIRKEYEPLAKKSVEYDGKFWMFPQAVGGLALVYNPRLVPRPPDTIAQFISESKVFRQTHPKDVYFDYPGRGNPYLNAPWFYGAGGYYISDKKVGVDTGGGAFGASLVQSLRKLMPKQDKTAPEERFAQGKQAWLMTEGIFLENLRKGKTAFDLAQWPLLDNTHRARPLVVVWGLAISPGTHHPAEAADLAYFMSTREFASAMGNQLAFIPAYKAPNDSWLRDHSNSMLARRILQVRAGAPFPNHPAMDLLWMPLSNMWEAIWQGGNVSPQLKKTQETMEQILKAGGWQK